MLRSGRIAVLLGFVVFGASVASAADIVDAFATVNGQVISRAELDSAVHGAARQRFYHGRIADERLQALRGEVAGELIDRVLLLAEARRRGVSVSGEALATALERERQQFRLDELSRDHRQRVLGLLREQVEEQLVLAQLEAQVKALSPLSREAVRAYYDANTDKFTTPPRQHLSVILLNVSPSATPQVWQAAENEAKLLLERLAQGADFAELARIHSGDGSASSGGDLGFVHQGMLTPEAQAVVDELQPGEVSAPVWLLQGVALFRLEAREPARLNPFDDVEERARGLLSRETAARAWEELVQRLRDQAQVVVHDDTIDIKNN